MSNAWSARTTGGYPSWFLIDQRDTAEADLVAAYQVVGSAWQDLVGDYSIATTTSTTGWFPRITDGHETWAGETLAPGSGSIDGAPVFGVDLFADLLSVYQVNQIAERDLTGTYSLVTAVEQDVSGTWTITASVAADLVATYAVSENYTTASSDLVAAYTLLDTVTVDLVAVYPVSGTVTQDLLAEYNVTDVVASDLSAEWDIQTQPLSASADLVATWGVYAPVQADLVGAFDVLNEVGFADLEAVWNVTQPVQLDLVASWQRGGSALLNLTAVWSVAGVNLKRGMRVSMHGSAMRVVEPWPPETVDTSGSDARTF